MGEGNFTLVGVRDSIKEILVKRLPETEEIHIVDKTSEMIVLGSEYKDTLLTLNAYGMYRALMQLEELRGVPLSKDDVEQYIDKELFRSIQTWYDDEQQPIISMEIKLIIDK